MKQLNPFIINSVVKIQSRMTSLRSNKTPLSWLKYNDLDEVMTINLDASTTEGDLAEIKQQSRPTFLTNFDLAEVRSDPPLSQHTMT